MPKQNKPTKLTLGCGLIRIGRIWGVENKPVPTEHEVQEFLEGAFELGIRFFDTAPAYGLSEARLGKFLKNLTKQQRSEATVATKFGEHWDAQKQEAFIDHTYNSLQSSLEKSLKILGKIDLLQLHKANVDLLDSSEIWQAFDLARKSEILFFGASVSDVATGLKACSDERLTYVQLPFNEERKDLLPVIKQAKSSHKKVLFNRPFAMGTMVKKSPKAYKLIADLDCPGVILTGTASLEHLKENLNNFQSLYA